MTVRTFRQHGLGYGVEPCNITATIDGNVVYSGNVSTLDAEMPGYSPGNGTIGVALFEWTNPMDFAGTQALEIAVSGSPLLLTHTHANFSYSKGNVNMYGPIFHYRFEDQFPMWDPLSEVHINGNPYTRPTEPMVASQWHWVIPAGTTFTATVNIQAGRETA